MTNGKSEVKRAARVAPRVQQELSVILRDLGDPRLRGVIVSRVSVTDDLQLIDAYVRLEMGADERAQRNLLKGLEAASKRLRRDLTQALAMRYAPNVRFHYDSGLDAMTRVESILEEIHAEKRPKSE